MKTTAFVLFSLFVGTLASPTTSAILGTATAEQVTRNERIVTGQIIEAIENLARQIREAGLDPFNIDLDVGYELPVPVLFSANALIENFNFKGLSNIVVQSMNFSLLQSRLTFNIYLPALQMYIGNIKAAATVFGEKYEGSVSGSLNINQIRMIGDVRVNVGIISGITIRSMSLNFSISSIESAIEINVFDIDMSAWVNNFLGTALPNKLDEFSGEINQLLEIVAKQIFENAMNSRFF